MSVFAGLSRRREDVVLRIVHELITNAVKHGMHMRLLGRITIRLACEADGSPAFSVANDGWRMEEPAQEGEGLEIVRELACAAGGSIQVMTHPQTEIAVRLSREGTWPPQSLDAAGSAQLRTRAAEPLRP